MHPIQKTNEKENFGEIVCPFGIFCSFDENRVIFLTKTYFYKTSDSVKENDESEPGSKI